MSKTTPYKNTKSKKEQITSMFNNIAPSYDILNHSLSLGMDYVWRKKAILEIEDSSERILDIATGTADFAITAAKYTNADIIGLDISKEMLNIGQKKITNKKLNNRIKLKLADCENLPFNDNVFDAITVGFGIRNFENIELGAKEMYRTLKTGGKLLILEPNEPKIFPLKQLYRFYFQKILPVIGGLISKDKMAYKYLPDSVDNFNNHISLEKILSNVGFKEFKIKNLTFGVVNLYIAIKKPIKR